MDVILRTEICWQDKHIKKNFKAVGTTVEVFYFGDKFVYYFLGELKFKLRC